MLETLRRKFISVTAAALFLTIFLLVAAVGGIFILRTDKMIDSRLELLLREYCAPSLPEGQQRPSGPSHKEGALLREEPSAPPFRDRLRIHPDGCVIVLNGDGSVREIRQYTPEKYSEEELADIASALSASPKAQGWHQYFKYRIDTRETDDGSVLTVIGLVNASLDLSSMATMLSVASAAGISGFLLALSVIVLASGRAVKPVAESYERQKQFVTDAGHELKTPLTVISADNELSRMLYGDSEWFDSIDRQVEKLNGLVRSLITLAKMDEEQTPVFSSFPLSDAVYDTAKSFEGLIRSAKKRLVLDIAEGICYRGDESGLRRLTSILMDNAAKYCDEGGTVTVRLTGGRQIRLQVVNDFSRTEECDFTRVFERFYRADKSRSFDGGYGLGLSIAKSVAAQHKGRIRAVVSDRGQVMFEVTLPRGV